MNPQENPNPENTTSAPPTTPDNTKIMSVLAYIGPLVIVSYITAKDNPTVKFHIKQGLVLLVAEVALWVIGSMLFVLWPLIGLVNFALVVLAIIGILNAVNGKEKPLPILGKFSEHFNI